ncbi:MAG: 50S ribosomal protein L11 methyltransferase [Lachnoanaerobaculum gingivalis]
MKWEKYTLITKTDAVDILSASLGDIGVEGIEIEDNVPLTAEETKGMFIDILPELPEDEGIAKVSFYLDSEADNTKLLEDIKVTLDELKEFCDIGDGVLIKSETEDKDWINNWKQYFKPFYVGDILIKPTWEEIPEDAKYKTLIQIDPGTAFGTGAHETTKLCILALEKYLKNRENVRVLDVGTGSGILGIAALKLGAECVFGTDLDDMAIDAVMENMISNEIGMTEFVAVCGDILTDENIMELAGYEKFDIVTANILAPVIIELIKTVAKHMRKGGIFITSGIIDTKEAEVVLAFKKSEDFEILEINHLGEWVSIVAKKRE